ncbi:MAG: hypothetical protein AB1486_00030 [Planctomycetota bacterium]
MLTTLGVALIVPALKFLTVQKGGKALDVRIQSVSALLERRMEGVLPSREPADQLPDESSYRAAFHVMFGEPEVGGSAFFTRDEVARFQERRRREGEWRQAIAPPLNVSGLELPARGILIRWTSNPRNSQLLETTARDPLLHLAYHVYRWTKGTPPAEIAELDLGQTEYLDQDLKAYAQDYFYSVFTVLEGRLRTLLDGRLRDARAIIESERSNVVPVRSSDSFEIEILHGSTDGVQLAITRTGPASTDPDSTGAESIGQGASHRREFYVRPESRVGRAVEIAPQLWVDFDTGLTLKSVREVAEENRVTVERPAFEPDGRRQVDPVTGDPLFESVPTILVTRRLVLECVDVEGRPRVLETHLGPPQELR